jgi:hypothetical protein
MEHIHYQAILLSVSQEVVFRHDDTRMCQHVKETINFVLGLNKIKGKRCPSVLAPYYDSVLYARHEKAPDM